MVWWGRSRGWWWASTVLAVLGCVAAMVVLVTFAGSLQANIARQTTSMTAPGMVSIGMRTPVNNEVDQRIVHAVVDRLRAQGKLKATADVYSLDNGTPWIEAEPAPGRACRRDEAVSIPAATDPKAPFRCVPAEVGYQPNLTFPTLVVSSVSVLTPEAMRLTGLPDAERAATVLANGGVVVSDATRLRPDGTVSLHLTEPGGAVTHPLAARQGAFVRGFDPVVAISPQTARDLGLTPRFVGVIAVPPAPLGRVAAARFTDDVAQITSVVWPVVNVRADVLGFVSLSDGLPIGELALGFLVLLAVVAVAVCVALGQVEAAKDMRVMHQVGAAPAQLRRYGMARGAVVVVLGTPPGLLLGAVASLGLVALLRWSAYLGAFTEVGVLAVALVAGVLAVVLGALVSGWLAGNVFTTEVNARVT